MCVTQIQTGPALQYWSHPVPLGAPHNLEESATRLQVPKVEPQRGKELQYMNGNCPYFPPQSTWTPGRIASLFREFALEFRISYHHQRSTTRLSVDLLCNHEISLNLNSSLWRPIPVRISLRVPSCPNLCPHRADGQAIRNIRDPQTTLLRHPIAAERLFVNLVAVVSPELDVLGINDPPAAPCLDIFEVPGIARRTVPPRRLQLVLRPVAGSRRPRAHRGHKFDQKWPERRQARADNA